MEAVFLRQLAQALDDLELLKSFDYQVAHTSDVSVNWGTGRACGGYKEMSDAISKVVSEQYDELRTEAIRRATARILEVRARIDSYHNERIEKKVRADQTTGAE